MWSSILMSLVICGAPPADSQLERPSNAKPLPMTSSEILRYGYTPTRWRSWNELPATIRIEHDFAAPSAGHSAVDTSVIGAGNQAESSHPVAFDDYADSPRGQVTPTSTVATSAPPRRSLPQSVPPSRLLSLEQPESPSIDVVSGVLGKPACHANQPAVLEAADTRPRLLDPTFDPSSRSLAEE